MRQQLLVEMYNESVYGVAKRVLKGFDPARLDKYVQATSKRVDAISKRTAELRKKYLDKYMKLKGTPDADTAYANYLNLLGT
jgi:hypothetical protein